MKKAQQFKKFFIRQVREGESVPSFYLPVRRRPEYLYIEAWIFPLAPFGWLYFMVLHIIRSVVIDCMDVLLMVEMNNGAKWWNYHKKKATKLLTKK